VNFNVLILITYTFWEMCKYAQGPLFCQTLLLHTIIGPEEPVKFRKLPSPKHIIKLRLRWSKEPHQPLS